jgi:hypothetical protein
MRRQMGLMIMPRLITAMKLGIVKRVELRKTGVIWGQIWGQNHTWWQIWGSKMYVIVCYSPVGRLCKLLILM